MGRTKRRAKGKAKEVELDTFEHNNKVKKQIQSSYAF